MKASRITAGEGQGGAWSSPRPFVVGRPGVAPGAYCAASPAGESFGELKNEVRAGRLEAGGATKI